ncbi:MAG TPA: DUF3795 domain-containing protein [Tissierellia bacterium]|nr:DUF3795 domain-containing protein [Tissierellia bacterium]
MAISENSIGKCGFYCGSCPTYISGTCKGCIEQHKEGDCFTRDCVLEQDIHFCGECKSFPCHTIMNEPKVTVLDKSWLRWKKTQMK